MSTPQAPLNIVIAGVAGHVGSNIAKYALSQGHTVLGLDRLPTNDRVPPNDRFSYQSCDLCDYLEYKKAVESFKDCNALIHIAAVFNRSGEQQWRPQDRFRPDEIHNMNVAMTYNALTIAGELGINRVALASSWNSMGGVTVANPRWDYVPVDEKHPYYDHDPYSTAKHICEVQADAFARQYPKMRIATLRYAYVAPPDATPESLNLRGGSWKNLWGWVSALDTARITLLSVTVGEDQFPPGHETFNVVGETIHGQCDSLELLRTKWPELAETAGAWKGQGNKGFWDTSKAKRLLGWVSPGFPWRPDGNVA